MAKTSTSFGEKNSTLEKCVKAAHTPEALAKMVQTRKANVLIKNEIFNALKDDLLKQNNKGKAYFSEYLDKFLAEAKKDPNGRCGQTVASIIFQQDILTMLDEQQERAMAKDLDFMRYRAIKRLFRQQRDVTLDYDKRKKCVICSRRAGKTDDNGSTIVYTAVTPNSPILYINKTFRNAIDQMWQLVEDQAKEVGLVFDTGTSKAEGMMVFTNGSTVKFGGNSNDAEADKYRGGKYRLIIIDEAGHQRNMKYLIDEAIGPCLSDFADSQLILTGTPPRIPHTYVEKCWNSSEYEKYHWTLLDNPFMPDPQGTIDGICKEKGLTEDSPFIQREYFGVMGAYDTEAMVFKGRQTVDEIDVDNLPFIPTNICLGVDWGFQDYNGIVTLIYNKDTRESLVIAEDKFNRSTITTIVNKVQGQFERAKELAMKYDIDLATVEVFCDNNERSIVSELVRNYNINAHCCWKYDKNAAISQLTDELRTGRMKILKGGLLDDEMDQILYKRDEEDNILAELDEDLGIHPDIMMALLYASRQMFLDFGYDVGGRSKEASTTNDINDEE